MKRFWFGLILLALMLQACSHAKNLTVVEERDLPVVIIESDDEDDEKPKYKAEATKLFDLIHTKLNINLDIPNSQVHGVAEITARPYWYEQENFVLDAKGMEIHKVELIQNSTRAQTTFDYNNEQLTIHLGRKYNRDEQVVVSIEYTAKPNEWKAPAWDAPNTDEGLYFIDPKGTNPNKPTQVWAQGETEANSIWFPTIDKPNQKMSQELIVTVDDKYKTLSNGALINSVKNNDGSRTDYWKQELPHPPYLAVLVVGDYAVVKDSWKGKTVDYYVEPEYEEYAKDIFGNTPEMIELFSNLLDYPYPWDKFSQIIVRDFTAGAMENTGAVTYHQNYQKTKRELLDGTGEGTIAHELFHHWFGDLVTSESWSNLPLNESFATYGEYLWNEYKYGIEEADYQGHRDLRGYLNEARQTRVPMIRYYVEHRDDMFDSHSYNKGGRVLHMLRGLVGDDAFFASLSKYLKDNEYQPAEIHHLRLAFEEVTGQDLQWFFNQWFMTAGHPELEIDYNYNESDGMVELNLKQVQNIEESTIFILPLAVDVYDGKLATRHEIVMAEKDQSFTFPSSEKPTFINVDAKKTLLGQKDEQKDIEEWVAQYNHAPLVLDRYEAVVALAKEQEDERAKKVMNQAIKDPYYAIRGFAMDKYMFVEKAPLEVKQNFQFLSQYDPKSSVRKTALKKLRVMNDDTSWGFIEKSFYDDSYQVSATALELYTDYDMERALEQAAKWENEKSDDVKMAVAEVYTESGDPQYLSYFNTLFSDLPTFKKYSLLKRYSTYLSKQDAATMLSGLDNLTDAAQNEKAWWMRYEAMSGLESLDKKLAERAETEDDNDLKHNSTMLQQKIKTIKEQETNERLIGIYADKDEE